MIVMVATNWNPAVPYLAGKYGGIGMMYSPDSRWRTPFGPIPYAVDNGRFQCWARGAEWDESKFLRMLEKADSAEQSPKWVVVPDVVGNATATLDEWDIWRDRLAGFRLAFVAQDGLAVADVPQCDVVFIGGTDAFKARTCEFIDAGHKVHVGRVNRYRHLVAYDRMSVDSVDGSGFFMGGTTNDPEAYRQLTRYLEWTAAGRPETQATLFA